MSRAVVLVILAGAALRFATLDVQSLWFDEAVTAQLLRMSLSGMLQAIPASESTPPLYYVLAWAWSHVFGTGEVGLRSLSALFGTATIAVVWALGRRLGGDRAGLIAVALTAFNPLLVWFSQEARAYALLALLGALAALLWLRAMEQPRAPGRAALWAIVAALALATHYYAIFLVVPQALWLMLRARDARVVFAALAPLAVALAGLAPLALGQRENDSAAFIRDSPLLTRLAQVPKQFLVGYDAPAEMLLAVLSLLLALVAAGGVRLLLARRSREDVPRIAGIVAAALGLALAAALAGEDHLITRNLLAVAPLGAALAGAGLAAIWAAWAPLGAVAAAGACVLGLMAVIGVDLDAGLQRDDWRGAVRALGHADGERVLVATPASALVPVRYYLRGARRLTEPALSTSEIDYVALAQRSPGESPSPPRPRPAPRPLPGYVPAGQAQAQTFTVLRLRSPAKQAVAPTDVAAGLDGRAAVVLAVSR